MHHFDTSSNRPIIYRTPYGTGKYRKKGIVLYVLHRTFFVRIRTLL